MKKFTLLALLFFGSLSLSAQNPNDHYYELRDYPDSYTPGNVTARVVDGLGFRFYWASVGLRPEDLAFKPSEEARTLEQTMDHIYNLTYIVLQSTKKEATQFPIDIEGMSYTEKRDAILGFLKTASDNLKASSQEDFEDFKIVFKYEDGNSNEYPFWNQLNGPIGDALWHTGQIVSMRRTAGNPFPSGVSVLRGAKRSN